MELKADKDLRNVSLHHVIRKEPCPYWKELREFDEEFKRFIGRNSSAPRKMIDEFNEVTSTHFRIYKCLY